MNLDDEEMENGEDEFLPCYKHNYLWLESLQETLEHAGNRLYGVNEEWSDCILKRRIEEAHAQINMRLYEKIS